MPDGASVEVPASAAWTRAWLPALCFAAAGAAALAGPALLDAYAVNVLIRAFLFAAVAVTVDVLWGYTGILTFGQSAFFGIGAYAAGLAFTHHGFGPGPAAWALAGGVAAAMAAAAFLGWLAFAYGVSPLYVSVVTLVFPVVVVQLIFAGGTYTGSSSGLSGFESFDLSMEAWFRIAGLGLVALTAVAWAFVRGDAGRLLVAVRENEARCEYLGIAVGRLKTLLFVAAAAVAAVSGYAYACLTLVVAPELASFVFGTEMVVWVALGGRGTLVGPVLGAIGVDATTSYLSGSLPFLWRILVGVVFVAVIVALPGGLASLLRARPWRGARSAGRGTGSAPVPALAEAPPRERPAGGAVALEVEDLRKRYGSLSVLEGVSLRAGRGELVSLVGPNGAGKSTLMRCVADGKERSAGAVRLAGVEIGRRPPHRCVALGVGRKFQTASVFESLTVAECLRVARTRRERPRFFSRAPFLALPAPALAVVRATGLDARLGDEARLLAHGQKQALELAMVLALEPDVVLLDEPTAGLTKAERAAIGGTLADLAARHGLCLLLVEHDLDFVRGISTRVVVLHQGRLVADGSVEEVTRSEVVRAIYAGTGHV